jgi:hypothetical protein
VTKTSGIVVVLGAFLLHGCGSNTPTAESDLLTNLQIEEPATPLAEITTPAPPPPPPVREHNYDERRGQTYLYISAVSEEDRKQGRAVGNVSAFRYFGRNADGEYILASLQPNGAISYRAKCRSTCRVIDTDYGESIPYSPTSIIGAAFEDAFRGKLQVSPDPTTRQPDPITAPITPTNQQESVVEILEAEPHPGNQQ